jgi:hypothetical protein
MANSLAVRCLALASSLCLSGAAEAAPPAGTYEADVVGSEVEVWFLEGPHELCEEYGEDSICVSSEVHTDALGIVSGTGLISFHLVDGANTFDLNLPLDVVGKSSGSTKKPRVALQISGEGVTIMQDEELGTLQVDTTGQGKFTCTNPWPHVAEFACKGRLKLCLHDLGRRSCFSDAFEIPVAASGGPWTLSLTLATDDKKKVTGTATTGLANGEAEAFTVTGKYDAKKDRSSLKLKKVDPSSKDRVSWSNFVESLDAGTIDFKLANESGKLKLIPPP